MSKLVITAAATDLAIENLNRSVEKGIPLAAVLSHPQSTPLTGTLERHSDSGRVRMWGSVAGENGRHRATWERIEPGDWIVFSTKGRFRRAARIYAMLDSPSLADSV